MTNRTPANIPTESIRILLWDIDGTLMRSTRMDSYKDYTAPMLEAVFGTAGRLHEMKVSGMTDLQIIAEALRDEGFTPETISERAVHLRERYMFELERVTGNGQQQFEVLPGVHEALQAAAEHPHYRSALLTGNIEPAAHLKMRLAGLSEYFELPGAYGDDSYDRRDLPALAATRINQYLGTNLEPHQFIVIGDTPNDIACAHHFGARAVAVATGRMYSLEDLRKLKPDALLKDLLDTELVMRTFETL
ncbi:MAG: HAD hydrolase-like protein [Pyrinomonadaceae bacterium]